MASEDITTTADAVTARDLAFTAFGEAGFVVTPTSDFTAVVERGSKTGTIVGGAFSGKKNQHVRYEVSVMGAPDGSTVVRMVSTTTGAVAGLIGVARERKLFKQWHEHLVAALPH